MPRAANPANENPRAVNRSMLLSSVAAYWGYATWPGPDSTFLDRLLPDFLMFVTVIGILRAFAGLRMDYIIRKIEAKAKNPSGKHGKATFARLDERLNAGLHDPAGLAFLGQCEGLPTFLSTGNLLIEAMQGSGKTSRIIVPTIFHLALTGRGVLVADSKPELVHMLAPTLWERGIRVKINNPSYRDGLPHDDSNPFRILVDVVADEMQAREAVTIAETLARTLVPDANDGKNKFFTQIDQAVLTTVLLALAVLRPDRCYPAQVWKHLADPELFEDLLFDARDSEALEGDLATQARALLKKDQTNPEHLESGRTGAANALSAFKPSSTLGRYGADHSFNIEDARDPSQAPLVVFDVMPADQLEVFAKAYELTNTSRLLSLRRHAKGREVVIVADEFTALPIRPIATDVEFIRSFGIRLIAAYQSGASLKRVYGEARTESLKANSAQLYFSVNDLKTAREISERIGDRTIKTESYGFGEQVRPSRNVSEAGRRLVPPEELLAMGRSEAILSVPGMRPVKLNTVPWYEIAPLKDQLGSNPHELHPKSPVTRLRMEYGKDVSELRPPHIPGPQDAIARLRKTCRKRRTSDRVPLVRGSKLLWVPLCAGLLAVLLTVGTPHVLLTYRQVRGADAFCGYVGIGGMQIVRARRGCQAVEWLPAHAEALP